MLNRNRANPEKSWSTKDLKPNRVNTIVRRGKRKKRREEKRSEEKRSEEKAKKDVRKISESKK